MEREGDTNYIERKKEGERGRLIESEIEGEGWIGRDR